MKKYVLASALVLSVFAAHAQAYGEIGYLVTDVKEDRGDGLEASPDGFRAIFGYEVDPNMAIEAMAVFGADDANIKINGLPTTPNTKLEIRNSMGIYIKPKYKINNKTEIFARVGFARVKGAVSVPGLASRSLSDNGLSYGAGIGFSLNKSTSVNFDYMQYLNKDEIQVNGFTVGLGLRF